MAKKQQLEPVEYDVEPEKTECFDKRLESTTCPLCQSLMNSIRYDDHPWGEWATCQCPDCGTYVDLCNMVEEPREFELIAREMDGSYFETIRTVAKRFGEFTKSPESQTELKIERDSEEALKQENKVNCKTCNDRFTPRKSSKAVREYCSKCRKEIPKDDKRWKKS